jgi:ribosomal protein S18 acetylase RimI-like enzyme
MVRLEPMTPTEFATFVEYSIVDYADSNFRSGQYPMRAEALEASKHQFAQILPSGQSTPGHEFLTIRREDGTRVGTLWLAYPPARGSTGAYVYSLAVDEAHRRHGYAEAAMRLAESRALAHGQTTLGLNVFGFNAGARALYDKLGYEVVATLMRKELTPAPRSP